MRWIRTALAGLGALGVAIVLVATAAPCRAATLADVDSFSSLNDQLFFSDFTVIATGSLGALDLTSIEIVPTESGFGFDLVGPLSANGGEIGDLLVSFDVDAQIPILAASLSFNGAATGRGAGASVTETFDGLNVQAFVFAIGDGPILLNDQVDLGGRFTHLRATKDIIVDSSTIGPELGSAQISLIRQEFIVPEPASLGLLVLGLGSVLLLRRRV